MICYVNVICYVGPVDGRPTTVLIFLDIFVGGRKNECKTKVERSTVTFIDPTRRCHSVL